MDTPGRSIIDLLEESVKLDIPVGGIIPAERVLVLAPHHDDEVLGCGGTILRYLEGGAGVSVIYLTDGRYGVTGKNKAIRREEAERAWNGSGIKQFFWDYEDSHLYNTDADARLLDAIDTLKPDVIFTPWLLDIHTDHKMTGVFLSRALNKLQDFNGLIACYEVFYPLHANRVVNITGQLEKKLEIIREYKSQTGYLGLEDTAVNLSRFRASTINLRFIRAAEAFFLCRAHSFIELANRLLEG